MLRENTLKIKLAAFVIYIVTAMFMSLSEVKAEAAPEVLVDGIIYTIDEGNKEALVYAYENANDSTCKEITVLPQVSYAGENYPVTEIGDAAFSSSIYLEKITIPGEVKVIGINAFAGCSALAEVDLSDGLEAINVNAFINCSSLEKIVIPNTVTYLGTCAFSECKKLKKVVIPNSVIQVEESCFRGCEALEEIVLSENITMIEYGTFFGCENLERIMIPEKVTRIEDYAFENCTNLKEVAIPDSVTTIEYGAFSNCESLIQVVIPEGVTEADKDCFDGCINMETIFYPEHLKDGFANPYLSQKGTTQFSYIINPDGTVSLKVEYLPDGTANIELPADIGGRQIVSVTGPQGVNLPVSCTKHYTKTYTKSADSHQYTCAVCKKPVKEAHSYPSGSKPCVCGYVPFAIAVQPTGLQLAYAHKDAVLSVTAKATFGTENITYQWLENGTAIVGATSSTYKIPQKSPVGSHTYTCKLTSGGYSQVTKAAIVTVKPPVKGKKYKDDANMATYKVTKARVDGQGTAEYVKPVSKKKATVIIPATVEIGGVTYKVTAIAKNAFKGNKNLKRVTIEKNVGKIGANAFSGCKKLKNITIKTTKLKTKKVGANAFKNIKSNATIKVPKKKLKAYKSMLKKKGVGAKAKIKKL